MKAASKKKNLPEVFENIMKGNKIVETRVCTHWKKYTYNIPHIFPDLSCYFPQCHKFRKYKEFSRNSLQSRISRIEHYLEGRTK